MHYFISFLLIVNLVSTVNLVNPPACANFTIIMPTASIYTLGCRLNQADSALIADRLTRGGYELVGWNETADVMVVNGCVVTATAGQKTRQAVRSARKRCPDAFIVLVGCAATLEKDTPNLPANLILDNTRKNELLSHLPAKPVARASLTATPVVRASEPATPSPLPANFTEPGTGLYSERTRANLKVQEGCDFFCSYCIVPHVRGAPRSRDWNDVLREARELLYRGHRELVLTGVNLGTYNDNDRDLADLIGAIADLPGDFRIRLGSVEPTPVVRRVVDVMADLAPRVCRFLHLPLQYGENRILKAMNRRYTTNEFREHADYALQKIDDLCLGTDLIVGFPGETEDEFAKSAKFVESIPWGNFHVFRYSPREGTPAAKLKNQMPGGKVAAERSRTIEEIYAGKLERFKQSQLGKKLPVLVERRTETGKSLGWSDNYLEVELAPETLTPDPVDVVITDIGPDRRVIGAIAS